MIDDGSTDATAAVARGPGARVVAEADDPARGRARVGQGQRAVEVAARVPRRHRLLARRRPPQLRRRTSSTGCSSRCSPSPTSCFVKALLPTARSKARRPAAAASPSSSPGRCSRCCSRSSPTSCSRSAASTRAGATRSRCCRSSRAGASSSGCSIDVVERFGRDAVAQVDLGVREHRNRPLDELGAAGARDPRDRAARAPAARGSTRPYVELLRATTDGSVDAESRSRSASARRSSRIPAYRAQVRPRADRVDSRARARVRPASTAASSTSSAARANASPACQTRSVSASTCDAGAHARARRGRRRSTWPAITATCGTPSVVGPGEHAADDLAREARRVELALAGDHERRRRRARPRARPPRRRRRSRARARAPIAASPPARPPAAPPPSSAVTSTPVRVAVLLGELLEPAGQQRDLRGGRALLRSVDARRVDERASRRRTRPSRRCPAATSRAPRPRRARRRSSRCRRPRRRRA